MTTVINTQPSDNSSGPFGLIIGLIVLVVFGFLVYYYGLPALQNMQSPQINVPSEVDINVNQTE